MKHKIKEMTVMEILEKVEFPPHFMEEFKDWCAKQPSAPAESGMLAILVYSDNPFLKLVGKNGNNP